MRVCTLERIIGRKTINENLIVCVRALRSLFLSNKHTHFSSAHKNKFTGKTKKKMYVYVNALELRRRNNNKQMFVRERRCNIMENTCTFPSQVPTTENSALFIQTMPIITLVKTA